MHCSHQRWCHFQSLKKKRQPLDTEFFFLKAEKKIFVFKKKGIRVDKALEKGFLN